MRLLKMQGCFLCHSHLKSTDFTWICDVPEPTFLKKKYEIDFSSIQNMILNNIMQMTRFKWLFLTISWIIPIEWEWYHQVNNYYYEMTSHSHQLQHSLYVSVMRVHQMILKWISNWYYIERNSYQILCANKMTFPFPLPLPCPNVISEILQTKTSILEGNVEEELNWKCVMNDEGQWWFIYW